MIVVEIPMKKLQLQEWSNKLGGLSLLWNSCKSLDHFRRARSFGLP